MILLAIFLGLYSYSIFFLGLTQLLYPPFIVITTFIFIGMTVLFLRKKIISSLVEIKHTCVIFIQNTNKRKWLLKNKLWCLLLILLIIQISINLIGTLGPELAFDALWYHLTLPKIFLMHHAISFLPGGLFNYSVMPKLGEMYYITALTFGNEILAKCIHFAFGILICLVIYQFSRRFFDRTISLLAVVIFYSNLVVDWESITAYIDLIRAFFECISLIAFVNWIETKKTANFVLSAVLLGFAISAKVLAIGSIAIFCVLIAQEFFDKKQRIGSVIKYVISFGIVAMVIPLPWLLFAFRSTGDLFYPIFSQHYGAGFSNQLLNPLYFIQNIWGVFTHAADPISPIYIITAPLLVVGLLKLNSKKDKTEKNSILLLLGIYALISIFVWYITPNTGGGRFILTYLPVYSILVASLFTYPYSKPVKQFLLAMIILIAVISIAYRGIANKRYIPVLVGKETKTTFLTTNLNYSFGDFSDTDGFFTTHIKPTDMVLLYGFHNEYYVDFPFIDNSFAKRGDRFDYVAIQHGGLPKRFYNWTKIYHNTKTDVSLYQSPNHQWINY